MKAKKHLNQPTKAIIYCRVSSDRQVREGDGLNSQEKRCREHAEYNKLPVEKVFKDGAISGKAFLKDRPGMRELLAYLATKDEPYYLIIDHTDRLSKDMGAYVEIRAALDRQHAKIISPSGDLGDSPQEQFLTNITVSSAQFQRQINAEQVKNRQLARLQGGFWTFYAPLGYTHVKAPEGGKVLVRYEPIAKMIGDAFEGFAAGRFETQADVAHFFERSGSFPLGKKGKFHISRVKSLLTNVLYAGYIEYKNWDITLRPGKHQGVTDLRTFQKVQERLGLRAKAPYRKDLREDFPLRGFVLCATCKDPLTASWSKARNGDRHAYYHCKRRGCAAYGKSIKRAEIEENMGQLLQSMTPSAPILRLAEEVVRDIHHKMRDNHTALVSRLEREIEDIDRQTKNFMDRLIKTEDPSMIRLYEGHVKKLEDQRLLLVDNARQVSSVDTGLEAALGTVFEFLGNPYDLWSNGDLEDKRTVLKLAFAKQLPFDKKTGFGTALTSLPFKVFSTYGGKKEEMVEGGGFEPPYS